MTANQIEANAIRYAEGHTEGYIKALGPTLQEKPIREEYMKNIIFYKRSINAGIDPDTGGPISANTSLGGLGKTTPPDTTVIPTASTGSNAITPGDTANIPFGQLMQSLAGSGGTKWEDVPVPGVDEQVENLETALTKSGLDPETFWGLVMQSRQIDLSSPEDAEAARIFKTKYGIK